MLAVWQTLSPSDYDKIYTTRLRKTPFLAASRGHTFLDELDSAHFRKLFRMWDAHVMEEWGLAAQLDHGRDEQAYQASRLRRVDVLTALPN